MTRTSVSFMVALWVSLAWAQPRGAADTAAEFVVGNCFLAVDDISRVRSMARVLKWRSLSPDMSNAVKPVDAIGHESWQVTDEGQTYLVGVNTGTFQGKRAEVCSVVANQP